MNKKQAKAKIKEHITKRGNQQVTVTPAIVRLWWRILNVALFDNKLHPPDQIVCRNFKQNYGWCDGYQDGRVVIGVRESLPTRHLMLTVIAHEMVHQWQVQNGYNNAHNAHFFKWREPFRKVNLPLRVWIDDECEYRIHG